MQVFFEYSIGAKKILHERQDCHRRHESGVMEVQEETNWELKLVSDKKGVVKQG